MSTGMSPFSAGHFTVCLLTRIYNSSAKGGQGPDLSKQEHRKSLVAFVADMTKEDVSHAIFMAVHFPGTLDARVDLPQDLVDEVSRVLSHKFEHQSIEG